MCRWITLISAESYSLSDVVLAPSNSLIQLSRDASFHPDFTDANNATMNGDGFGIGWYHKNIAIYPDLNTVSHDGTASHPPSSGEQNGLNGSRHGTAWNGLPRRAVGLDEEGNPVASAAVFKDVFPAWNNMNLRELCMATSSDCIMAHVRAASKGTGISHQNCHPFKAGRLLFCHNGRVFEFFRFKRRFRELLTDEAYNSIMGTTDSENLFALLLTYLARDGHNEGVSPFDQTKPFGAKRLVAATKKTINAAQRMIEEHGPKEGYSTFNFSLTDGETMVVTRFCDKGAEIPPPSLYFAFGDARSLYLELTNEDHKPIFSSKSSASSLDMQARDNKSDSSVQSEGGESGSVDSDGFDERAVLLREYASRPGKVMEEVDAATAAFIVSSNPLTRTHLTWHPMPRNSIMWCTRGQHPELSVLKRRQNTLMSVTELKL